MGSDADKLIAAFSEGVKMVRPRTHLMEDCIAGMRPVEAIKVALDEPTVLEPGELHLMLMGLKEKLVEGGTILLTPVFEKPGEVTLDIPILAAKAMDHGEHGKMKHDETHAN